MNSNDYKQTLVVDINVPEHEQRKRSSLFTSSRVHLIDRNKRCFICGKTADESLHPLEAHHHPIEWSMTNMTDWRAFSADCKAGLWGEHAAAFDWDKFLHGADERTETYTDEITGLPVTITYLVPVDPYLFVDDMRVNGMVLCKDHHVGVDEGMHMMPFPLWVAQKYAIEGYQFSKSEQIHHG